MPLDIRIAVVTLAAAAWICSSAQGQTDYGDLGGFVTIVGGSQEVSRIEAEAVSTIPAAFSYGQNRIEPGEGVRTGDDATAVVLFPGLGAVAYLDPASELRLVESLTPDSGIGVFLVAVTGRVSVVRKPSADLWLLFAVETEAGDPVGYTLSKGASLFVEAEEGRVTFAARHGDAVYYSGGVPAGVLIDASGQPADVSGVALRQGQRLSAQVPERTEDDERVGLVVPGWAPAEVETFALAQSELWLKSAERGDFTPVRGATRAAPELLGAQFAPALVFDQAVPSVAVQATRPATSPVRTTLNPSQALLESGVPGTVIAGQRFRRSRIIGNPGTTTAGTGALTVNRAAELLVTLSRD